MDQGHSCYKYKGADFASALSRVVEIDTGPPEALAPRQRRPAGPARTAVSSLVCEVAKY
jgi:hypothetical protein